jgi:DNA-directed RNA polymerase subunit E'
MFKILYVTDEVRVPPVKFDLDLDEAVKQSLQEQIEGKMHSEIGVFLVITSVLKVGDGKIIPEDGAIYYPVEFKVLVYKPEINEIVVGEVVDITEFGAFTRIGPIDALVHVSQIMDDKISYDAKNSIFTGKKSGIKLKEGDLIRARVVGVSLGKGRSKVSLTMRQPALGAIDWIERDKKKSSKK